MPKECTCVEGQYMQNGECAVCGGGIVCKGCGRLPCECSLISDPPREEEKHER